MGILKHLDRLLMLRHVTAVPLMAMRCRRHGCDLRRDGAALALRKGEKRIRIAQDHLIYSLDLAQHFETYFSQVVPNRANGISEVDYSRPRLHVLGNGLSFELSSLPEESEAIESYFRFFRPRPGDLAFDIGAYCGVFTHALAHAVGPEGRVVAFEPDPKNLAVLHRNIQRHNLSNVVVCEAAVLGRDGEDLFNTDGFLGSAVTRCLDRPPTKETVTVETITLTTACQRYGRPAFIKIDAEGAEIEILSAAIPFLRRNRIPMVIDTTHWRDGQLTCAAVERLLREAGYSPFSLLENGFSNTWTSHCIP